MKFDLQDLLLVLGIASLVGGIAAWSRPAAFVVFGVICLVAVVQIERTKTLKKGASDGSALN